MSFVLELTELTTLDTATLLSLARLELVFVETTLETAILLAFDLILEACELLITTEPLILDDTDPL